MMAFPICLSCKHATRDRYVNSKATCKAFPEGIPDVIYVKAGWDHRLPFEGDHGIRFELDTENEARVRLQELNWKNKPLDSKAPASAPAVVEARESRDAG